jgi:hypothetical protein
MAGALLAVALTLLLAQGALAEKNKFCEYAHPS